jgi:hypothetical protein
MSLELILTLLGLILIMVGCVFFFIASLMERHYDRKLFELNQKIKQELEKGIK